MENTEIGFKNVNICKMIYRPILLILSECGPAPVTFNSHNKQANWEPLTAQQLAADHWSFGELFF